jgi:hypothetical protein
VNFKITIDSNIPTSDTISCGVQATLFETATQHVFDESAAVAATRSGSSATCTTTIPYSWLLTAPSQDMVTISFSLGVPAAANQPNLPNRASNQTIAIIAVPVNGVTTTENIAPVF